MGGITADGGWFGPGDDFERAWDEAEAILLATEDLDAVMAAIREAESPVEARRALKLGFGFTGRQAALLLTLPVMSFTRSERQRLDAGRRARLDLLADVTGVLPAIQTGPRSVPDAPSPASTGAATPDHDPATDRHTHSASYSTPTYSTPTYSTAATSAAPISTPGAAHPGGGQATDWSTDFGAAFDGVLAGISSAMAETEGEALPRYEAPPAPGQEPLVFAEEPMEEPTGPPVVPARRAAVAPASESVRPMRRSLSAREDASAVLDEQIGELCDAIAMMVGVAPPAGVWSDDPRSSSDTSGAVLDGCGVDDRAGLRTLLWHLRRTGLDRVEGLFPFAEPLTAGRAFDAQAVRFESAIAEGRVGSQPAADVHWASGLWPIAERRGFGYAVAFGDGPDAGSVWAYGGDEPLHRLWDSVVDLLVELYQSMTTGTACDAAIAAVLDGRVVWTNLS